MKIIKKFLIILVLINIIFLLNPQKAFCDDSLYSPDSLQQFSDSMDSYDYRNEDVGDKPQKIINNVLSALIAIGAVVAVVIIAIIGFNYMLGSAEEKAVESGQMITLLIGAVLLSAGSVIVKFLYNVAISW